LEIRTELLYLVQCRGLRAARVCCVARMQCRVAEEVDEVELSGQEGGGLRCAGDVGRRDRRDGSTVGSSTSRPVPP
jgi:hypothetical protein